MMPANVIQLRQMLSEKFPEAHLPLERRPAAETRCWPTGLPQIDEPLRGGLPKGALAELSGAQKCSGSATLLREILSHAARRNEIVALIDGNDSLEVARIEERVLSRLLWVRCRGTDEALKAADLVLRDNNLPLVLIDLKLMPERQLRKIPATVWYRFQRLVEETSAVCLVFTSRPMVSPAQTRIALDSAFSLATLEKNANELLDELKLEISDRRQFAETANLLRSSA
ncbi:MAG TPA: hypothetical protein VGY56_07300 [Verrucomicrobiae bacterium]|nr:hypothetical protein [Verrucomicrobiae bacterium]